MDPSSPQLRYNHALALRALKRYDEAKPVLRAAIDLAPNQPLFRSGPLFVDVGDCIRCTVFGVSRLLHASGLLPLFALYLQKITPSLALTLSVPCVDLGWLLFESGDVDGARQTFEAMIERGRVLGSSEGLGARLASRGQAALGDLETRLGNEAAALSAVQLFYETDKSNVRACGLQAGRACCHFLSPPTLPSAAPVICCGVG